MLKKLIVKNFAIIEDITLEFNKGMTVITGQTGAGKSLIIDTISLLLGARADSDMIRYNENEAYICGIFDYNLIFEDIFNNNNIKIDDEVKVERIITNNKNTIKINNTSVSLNILKQIAIYLANLHIQNDTFKLFNQDTYIDLLDPKDDDTFNNLLNSYTKSLYDYNLKLDLYNKIKKSQNELNNKLEYLEFEHKEISSLNLYLNIDKELEEDINKLSNFDKISYNLNLSKDKIDGEYSAIDNIYDAAMALDNLKSFSNDYLDYSTKLLDVYYIAKEIKDNIAYEIDNLDYDEEELNNKTELMLEIDKLKAKYKMSVEELIEYDKKISLDIQMATNYEETLNNAKEDVIKYYDILIKKAIKLSDYRKNIAKKLEKGIIKECNDLDLENALFEVKFSEFNNNDPFDKSIFYPNGIDKIDFYVSFNKGEPTKPLYKVASGGEASRLMLAFKSYFSSKDNVGLLIFDEIDSGVSGITAMHIAKKMYEISKHIQLICITHLASVAAIGDNHKFISKEEKDNRTYTRVKDLSYDERVEEIALMISGDKLSIYAIENAKALLNNK